MLRLAKVLVVIFLLAPISASPLGLGDIRLHSALNQQLDAEIDMIALGQTRVEDIVVRLATREAFERAGIERPLFLSRLRFEVETGPGNTANIRIRSDQPVREPFLNFLVEVNWPNGRLLREYTVLLDPPLFLDETPAAIQVPAVSVAETPARVAAPRQDATADATTPRTVSGRLSASIEIGPDGAWSYGPVQQSDTLWSIARGLRAADESVSIEQIMMALLRNNPEAFFNNNINELRAGHVLRIGDPSMIGQLSHAEAVAEARRQFAQWQDAKGERAEAAGPRAVGGDEGGAMATSSGTGIASDTGPRLRLSAPDTADAERFAMSDVEVGDARLSDAATVSRLREDLVSALEISESARQENLELRQRLADMEEQISAMQRLLSLQDDTMSALQAGGVGSLESQPTPAAEAEGAAETAVETPKTVPPVAVAPPIIPEITGLITTILDDPMMLGVATFLVLMLATLGWLIVRRRQVAGATLEELTESPEPESRRSTAVTTPIAARTVAGAASASAAAQAVSAVTLEESIQETGDSEDDIGLDIMQAEDDEIDILAEAEVYLAYRRFDKAEELLRDAIGNEPGRQDLALKLLEVHAGSGNAQAFIAQAESLHASLGQGDEAMWDKVVAMGRRLAPGHALFARAGGAAPAQTQAIADPRMDAGVEITDTTLTAADFAGNLDDTELDFSAGMDLQDEGADFTHVDGPVAGDLTDLSGEAPAPEGFADLDLTLDDETLAKLETGTEVFASGPEDARQQTNSDIDGERASGERPLAGEAASATAIDATLPAAESGDGLIDNELEKQLLAAGSGQGSDVDWLSEIGNDLDFADMEGDEAGGDFSGLISGEDEVGTKLDLARAYIDMGDQDSARSILNEVTEEGNEDQQRQANDLMRRIG